MGVMLMLLEGITKGSPVSPNFPRIKVGLVRRCDWCLSAEHGESAQDVTILGDSGFLPLGRQVTKHFSRADIININ